MSSNKDESVKESLSNDNLLVIGVVSVSFVLLIIVIYLLYRRTQKKAAGVIRDHRKKHNCRPRRSRNSYDKVRFQNQRPTIGAPLLTTPVPSILKTPSFKTNLENNNVILPRDLKNHLAQKKVRISNPIWV